MFMISHLSWLSVLPGNHLGVSLIKFHSQQQLFKNFSTLFKSPNPPHFSSLTLSTRLCSLLDGEIEITEREIAQLRHQAHRSPPQVHHPFLLTICLTQEGSLFQAKPSSLSQALCSPTSLSPLDAHFIIPTVSLCLHCLPSHPDVAN